MNRFVALCCALAAVLPACAARVPVIPYPSADPAPLAQAIEEQRQRFTSLRSLARIETEQKGRRRVYESVAIVQRKFERLRVEGYGPLGQTLFTILLNGTDLTVLQPDGSGPRTLKGSDLRYVIGVALEPADLCAVLAGGAPRFSPGGAIAAGCSSDGRCAVDVPEGDGRWRVHVRRAGPDGRIAVDAVERYDGAKLLFLIRYEDRIEAGGYALPRRVVVQDPGREASMTVEYLDAEVGGTLADDLFLPTPPE